MSDETENWVISFGPYRAFKVRRLLERDGVPLHIGSRAFDILVYLLEHRGEVVSHRALLEAAWAGLTVDEGNLRYQMSTLRKVLSDGERNYIINIPGRGYCFTAEITRDDSAWHLVPRLTLPSVVSTIWRNRPYPPVASRRIPGYSRRIAGRALR